MELIKQKVEFLTPINREEILKNIEIAARTCYKSEQNITENSASRMVKNLVKNGHTAMIEMGGMITVKVTTNRAIANEIVRHRIASYAQESTRYVNYGKKPIKFILPHWVKNLKEGVYTDFEEYIYRYNGTEQDPQELNNLDYYFLKQMYNSEHVYNILMNEIQPQQARDILPLALATELVVSMNLRAWKHFIDLRSIGTTGKPHPDIKEIADIIKTEFNIKLPEIFN